MIVKGIGILGCFGRGTDSLISRLEKQNAIFKNDSDGYCVDDAVLKDELLSRKLRRADRFTKMAVLAASDSIKDYDNSAHNDQKKLVKSRTGIILVTAFGPHNTTFSLLDDILEYGEDNISPIKFSHSVHNAAASYIALLLNITGPTTTITQFKFPVHHGLMIASCWLKEGLCDDVLFCCVDERGAVLDSVAKEKLNLNPRGKWTPLEFSSTASSFPSEGSVCMLLGNNKSSSSHYCRISDVAIENRIKYESRLCILGTDGMPADESEYTKFKIGGNSLLTYSPAFGSMLIGSSFDCAIGSLILKNKRIYPIPLTEGGGCEQYTGCVEAHALQNIVCHKIGYNNTQASILLESDLF